MAFKPIRREDSTTAISAYDPAIDLDRSDMDSYAVSVIKSPASWREHIKSKDGQHLTEFIIGVVPPGELTRIYDECGFGEGSKTQELRWRCFLHGIREIKNWEGDVPKKEIGGVEYVDPEWLERTFVRGLRTVAISIGFQVFAFNQLTQEEAGN